jgi:3',5'-nucleoside bisphosphate phosphatase
VSKVDLHIHTTASDGKFSPAEIVRRAAAMGMEAIAITDHDTVEGIAPALETAREYPFLRVIPGVELSTDVPKGEVHILGYFIDYTNKEFRTNLEKMRTSRTERARKMVEKLQELGINIEWQRVQEIAGDGTLARPHVAQALLEKGYVTSFQDAFTRYIGHGKPAYVTREKLTPVEAVQMIIKAHGLPVLAHPFTVDDMEETITELKAAGLVGLEAYYALYSLEEIHAILGLTYRYGLIPTGGTDYHGINSDTETMLGGMNVPVQTVEQLVTLEKDKGLNTINPVFKGNI